MNPARFLLLLAATGLLAGCNEKPKPPADPQQEAIRQAITDYFEPKYWLDKPCLVKKSEFTKDTEYPLSGGLPPAKVIDLEELRKIANGDQLSSEWVIIQSCNRKNEQGKDMIHVSLRCIRENLDPKLKMIPRGGGKGYQFEVQGDTITLVKSDYWTE